MKRSQLKRTEFKRDKARATALRRTKLKLRGRKSAQKRKRDFGDKADWVRTLPCVVCGWRPSDPHHEPFLSQGGTAKNLVSLCRSHHTTGMLSRHNLGSLEVFESWHSVDLMAEAARIEAEWRESA